MTSLLAAPSRREPARRLRRTIAVQAAITVAAVGVVSQSARAAVQTPIVTLKVGFSPDRPGANTTVSVAFRIHARHHETLPPPATGMEVRLPAGMGLGTTNLGEATCTAHTLEYRGPRACANALMGLGESVAEAQIGSTILREQARVAIVMAPAANEHTTVLYLAEGLTPVYAETIFSGQMLAASPPYGARMVTTLPLAKPLPEDPTYVALVQMRTTLGPQGLTYYKTIKGVRVPYHPRGIAIPRKCPRGGYPFAVRFTFLNAGAVLAKKAVRCPYRRRSHTASGVRSHHDSSCGLLAGRMRSRSGGCMSNRRIAA